VAVLADDLGRILAAPKRGNSIDAEWIPRSEELEFRQRAAGSASELLPAVIAILPDASDDIVRHALWLCLPMLPDADLPLLADAAARIASPDARLLAIFLLLGRAASAPAWWQQAARATLAAVEGKTARTSGTLLANVGAAVADPARFDLQGALHAGGRLFNAGQFFEAHEVWEDVWRPHRGPERDFFRGLINLAVAMNKCREGNASGMVRLLDRSLGLLASGGESHRGVDLAALRKQMSLLRGQAEEWREGRRTSVDAANYPRLPDR
jgi:uncharacterized protein